jgi:hypothetical protein
VDTKITPMRKKLFHLLQYWWRLAIPFWLFRDANHGTPEQRIANYRYNRSLRRILPFYMLKWVGIALCMIMMTRVLSELMARTVDGSADHLCATMFCMSAGIGFAFSCVVLAVLTASYLFLTYIKR